MLSFFVTEAHAMGAQGGGGGDPSQTLMGLMPLLLMFVIFYFLLIRPQQKRAKEHKAMLEALQRGDDIVTTGGLQGKITGITDDALTVEIAKDVRVKVDRQAVARKRAGG
ncbi:MAG TPA: preprotein translocase subunit YajC [Deferrisomatales bacterium]|nr:preprotein translocase subunit YajC [Deferrisomatales bacterium]